MIRLPNRRPRNPAFVSRAERESIKARSLRSRLSGFVTRKMVKDFVGGMFAGLVLFSPLWLQIAGCVTD